MKYLIFISVLFIFGCIESVQNNSKKQPETEKANLELAEYNEIESFKLFCDSIPNVILPFRTNCVNNIIPTDNKKEYNRIMNPKYIGNSWAVDGKIEKENYILIIHHFDTDGSIVFLRTLDKKGIKIDEIKLYHADCVPTTEDTFDIGYVIFESSMKITQIDSTLWYKTDENGNQLPNLDPIGREHYRFVYQLSDSGEFSKIK